MMVLRHIGTPTATAPAVVSHDDNEEEEEDSIPMDLSNKHSSPSELTRNFNKPPYTPRQRNSTSTRPSSEINSRTCRPQNSQSELRWKESFLYNRNDEESSYSSPDSGLHRDSLGEDEDFHHSSQRRSFIPLSRIQARYSRRNEEPLSLETEEKPTIRTSSDQVQTKRARLDCLISHIKQSKPLDHPQRNSEERFSKNHRTTTDEPMETDESSRVGPNMSMFGIEDFSIKQEDEEGEPCNISKSNTPNSIDPNLLEAWKSKLASKQFRPMSPSEAAKMYSIDPETYQQQMMQLQLTSAAMMGDTGGLLKAMSGCPPWMYLGYYSQLLHTFQYQEICRQYAMQSQNVTPAASQGEKSPSAPRTPGYNCRSPISPASLSEGPTGLDSDSGSIGQTTPGSASGKRAPRAMTGRHVRTGTGASPSTLQTLRLKIEERQRLKAQQLREGGVSAPQSSKGKNTKTTNSKKSKK